MISKGTRFVCDICGKSLNYDSIVEEIDAEEKGWEFSTEVGDLCSVCSNLWKDWKETFVTSIRKQNKGDLK